MADRYEDGGFGRRLIRRFRRMFDPFTVTALMAAYFSMFLVFLPEPLAKEFLTPRSVASLLIVLAVLLVVSKYLGIFADESPNTHKSSKELINEDLLWEIRNYLIHQPKISGAQSTAINLDEAFKGQLLARLASESQSALKTFIESNIFKQAAKARFREGEITALGADVDQMISTYQNEMASWRRNANVNLVIGLACAVIGIGVMWQTLTTLNFGTNPESSWRIADLYRFLARLGLVLIIESVAFFFLKLYREDRSMIRYLRNEITNLESKCLSLRTALTFGTPSDLSKVLQSLSSTERNFLIKKGERVISDITYENSEIMLEKFLEHYPGLVEKTIKVDASKQES